MEWDVNHSGSDEIDQRIREMSVWRLSRLRALAPPGLDSDDGADLVVACLMGELDFAERFQERPQVHPKTTAIAPAEAIPSANRVVLGVTTSFNGAYLGGLCSSAAPRSTQPPCSTSHV
jgi:hypothetical protein